MNEYMVRLILLILIVGAIVYRKQLVELISSKRKYSAKDAFDNIIKYSDPNLPAQRPVTKETLHEEPQERSEPSPVPSKPRTIPSTCGKCGANLELDLEHLITFCPYCGTKLLIDIDLVEKFYAEREKTKREELQQTFNLEKAKIDAEVNERLEHKKALINAKKERQLAREKVKLERKLAKAEIQKERERVKAETLKEVMIEREKHTKGVRILVTISALIIGIPAILLLLIWMATDGLLSSLTNFFSSF